MTAVSLVGLALFKRLRICLAALYYSQKYFLVTEEAVSVVVFYTRSVESLLLKRDLSTADR